MNQTQNKGLETKAGTYALRGNQIIDRYQIMSERMGQIIKIFKEQREERRGEHESIFELSMSTYLGNTANSEIEYRAFGMSSSYEELGRAAMEVRWTELIHLYQGIYRGGQKTQELQAQDYAA